MTLIKIFGFFIGLFIALIIISHLKINEPFTNISLSLPSIPAFPSLTSIISTTAAANITPIINENDDSILPYKGYKFMCINTYNNINKISEDQGKWFDIDDNRLFFKFNKLIPIEKNFINKKIGASGANINTIQLNGPECFYFANNSENYEITEFTMFMTIKIFSCTNKNNIIFEMTGNTLTTDNITPSYTTNIININFIVRENKNYDIQLLICDKIYKGLADNIAKDIIENNDYLIIGLYYKKDKIGLIFNNKIYEYENLTKLNITLGSTPIIINKMGSINMHLYNFVYYKTLFDFQYYDYLTRYNNYYLSGLNNKECPVKEEPEFKKEQLPAFEKIILPDFKFPLLHNYFEPFTQSTTDNENENENAEDYIRKDIDYINSINNERPSLNNSFI
jgi:hypothetical protein